MGLLGMYLLAQEFEELLGVVVLIDLGVDIGIIPAKCFKLLFHL